MNNLSQSVDTDNHDSERAEIQRQTIERQRSEIASLATKLQAALAGAGRLPVDITAYAEAALAAPPVYAAVCDETVLAQALQITRLWVACNEVAAATK